MIEFYTNAAGRFTVSVGNHCVHFFPKNKNDRMWGYHEDWYDGPKYLFGLGPFALFCGDVDYKGQLIISRIFKYKNNRYNK